MKKFNLDDKKYIYYGLTAFCVIAACILLYWAILRWDSVLNALSTLLRLISPFTWGLAFAYLLTPMTRWFEKQFFIPLGRKLFKKSAKKARGFARAAAVAVALIVTIIIIAVLLRMILPQFYSSLESIVLNLPGYYRTVIQWVERTLADYPEIEEYAVALIGNVSESITGWVKTSVLPEINSLVTSLSTGVYMMFRGLMNFLIGLIVSCYVLFNKETFAAHAKKILYSLIKKDSVDKLLTSIAFVDRTFMGFISGKLLDSLIIGILCYIGCSILKMPYVTLVSVLVGVTNIIPFFGPFIGAIPSAIIILMVSPWKCFIFIIFILVLQQFDGNILGPKILGNSTGLNGFWVMFAIIVGGGLFGFMGMLLGVPVFAVIYNAVKSFTNSRLKKRGMPTETAAYMNIQNDFYDSDEPDGGSGPAAPDETHINKDSPIDARKADNSSGDAQTGDETGNANAEP